MDLWPYVSGKALMSGLRLKEMDSRDLVDILHFFFEEDNTYTSEEAAKSQSSMRTALYQEMYGVTYKYKYEEPKKKGAHAYTHSYEPDEDFAYLSDAESVKPFSPKEMQPEMKPTMGEETITQFDPFAANPFDGILDAPMGH